MKVIIAGSRTIDDYDAVCRAVENSGFEITEVVWGKARGVDALGKRWADEHGVPAKPFPADWKNSNSPTFNHSRGYDPVAGHRRNEQMAQYADALVLVWDGCSTGSANMLERARVNGLEEYKEIVKL